MFEFKEQVTQLTTQSTNLADNFNRIHQELLDNDKFLKQELQILHEDYTSEQGGQDVEIAALKQKNIDQDTEISGIKTSKLNSSTFTSFKSTQEEKNTQIDSAILQEAQTREQKDTELQNAIDNKIGLNSVFGKQNFNFIENKVVQDGLVDVTSNPVLNNQENFVLMASNIIFNSTTTNQVVFKQGYSSTNGFELAISIAKSSVLLSVYKGVYTKLTDDNDFPAKMGECLNIALCFSKEKNTFTVFVNGRVKSYAVNANMGSSSEKLNAYPSKYLRYDRLISNQEIQHNFTVLNNSPSVNTLDVAGKKLLLFGSDEDHIEMATGRTWREEYMSLLKQHGKEVTSTGGAITILNGLKSRVINGEIKGQTVKNFIQPNKHVVTTNETLRAKVLPVEVGKQYTAIVKVSKFELTGSGALVRMRVHTNTTTSAFKEVTITGVGIFKVTATMESTNPIPMFPIFITGAETCNIAIDGYCLLEGDGSNFTDSMTDTNAGINSTKAIISNNGQSYHIYASEEDKTSKKAALLGVVGGVYDVLEIKEDGSGVYTQNTYEIKLNGSENWGNVQSDTLINTMCFGITLSGNVSINGKPVLSDKFKWEHTLNDNEHIYTMGTNIRVIIDKSKLPTQDAAGFKTWLQSNPVVVRYQLATPIVTVIPKELMPTIQIADKINILQVDSAVSPSSFTVNVPVDRIGDLEARLQAVESIINTPKNLSLQANYVEDEYTKLNYELEGMM